MLQLLVRVTRQSFTAMCARTCSPLTALPKLTQLLIPCKEKYLHLTSSSRTEWAQNAIKMSSDSRLFNIVTSNRFLLIDALILLVLRTLNVKVLIFVTEQVDVACNKMF